MVRIGGLLLLFIFCNTQGFAQVIEVVDNISRQPLVGVTIQAFHSDAAVQTDAKGRADLTLLPSPLDSVRLAHVGYQPRTMALSWLKGQEYTVALVRKNFGIPEVVISAGKFAQKVQLVPQQVEILKEKEINFINQSTTADLIQQTGQVLVQKSQLGGGSPVLRGFEANKVLLVIDGVRMNNAIYRGGHLQSIITLDNSVLDRAEIVFGPGSVVYGSDALGGVLHFHTKAPILADSSANARLAGEAYVRYGTAASERTAHAQFNYGRSKWGSLTAFTATDFGRLRQGANRRAAYGDLGLRHFYAGRMDNQDVMVSNSNVHVQRPTGYTQYDFLQKFLYIPSQSISHGINIQFSTSSDIPRYDRLTELSGNGKLKFAEWYYGPQQRFLASYILASTSSNRWYDELRSVLAFQQLSESRHTRRFQRNELANRLENVSVYSLNTDFDKSFNRHRLNYGFETSFNSVGSEAFEENLVTGTRQPISTRYPDGGSSMGNAAVYATHTWDVSPSMVLTQGIRYNWVGLHANFEDRTFFPFLEDEVKQQQHAVTGSLGSVLLPGMGWRFALQLASGFRAPNVDDLGKVFDSSPGNVIVPNPELEPEYTYNVELAASKTLMNRVQLQVNGYHTWYRNGIVVRPFALNGEEVIEYQGEQSQVTANANAGKARLYGVSGSLRAIITDALSFSSTLNYTYGRVLETEGDVPLDHIPPLHGRSSLSLQLRKVQAEFFVLYNGEKELKDYSSSGEDNLQYATPNGMPSWYTLNARAAYKLTPRLQLQAGLENMADRFYRVFASGISAPGRNIVLTVRVYL